MMSQRWTALAELPGGARLVPKDEADAYADEVERLREAIEEHRDRIEVSFRTPGDRKLYAALNGKESQ